MKGDKQWNNLDVAFKNYLLYIARKEVKFSLSLIDLLYVSNFKGGNASIVAPEREVDARLSKYSAILESIDDLYGNRSLRELTIDELEQLKKKAQLFIELPSKTSTRIKGLKASIASALLCAHFPNLLPVIDRNVLAGFAIQHEVNTQGQVINIETQYAALVHSFYLQMMKNKHITLRELDHDMFVKGVNSR
jgi:hypothetical protein